MAMYLGSQKVCPVVKVEVEKPSGKYQLLQRITDDSNNEIGTVSGFFTDSNDVEYAVVCLDAQYRNNSKVWCSSATQVTNMPLYALQSNVNPWSLKYTATQNCDWILEYCTANGYTSTAVSHCRSQSFAIDGITYYGQLPNIPEMSDILRKAETLNNLDTSVATSSSLALLKEVQWICQQSTDAIAWGTTATGAIYASASISTKTASKGVTPILELPNN